VIRKITVLRGIVNIRKNGSDNSAKNGKEMEEIVPYSLVWEVGLENAWF
jgi:hypothetical protein